MTVYKKNASKSFENWPLSPVEVWHSCLIRERCFPKVIEEKNCLLGNPELASRLFAWFHDAQESIGLQMWLHYNPEDEKLRTQLRIELSAEAAKNEDEWSHDLSSLMGVYDKSSEWSSETSTLPKWSHGTYLQINTSPDDEDHHSPRLIEDMLHIITKSKSPISVVVSLFFSWEGYGASGKIISIPPHIMENPRLRHRWLRMARRRQDSVRKIPVRNVRRRIAVLSTDKISSLVKQSVFRGISGNGPAYGAWFSLSVDNIDQLSEGPLSAIQFGLPKNHHDRVSVDEARSTLTSNHCSQHVHREFEHDQDDIPF